jgi:hypothetical protein
MTTFYMCNISYVNTPVFKHVASVMQTWRFCSISHQSVQVWPPCSQIIIIIIIRTVATFSCYQNGLSPHLKYVNPNANI